MARPALIVCEKSNRWAIALRSVLASSRIPVVETRSWPDAWHALQEVPRSVVAIELRRGNLVEIVRGLVLMRCDAPQAAAIVLGDPSLASAEWTLREAGAVHFVTSPRNLTPVASLVLRLLTTAELPSPNEREAIWERLPWKKWRGEATPEQESQGGEPDDRPPALGVR